MRMGILASGQIMQHVPFPYTLPFNLIWMEIKIRPLFSPHKIASKWM